MFLAAQELLMDATPAPFVPPAPKPRTSPPSTLQMMRIVYRNPSNCGASPRTTSHYIDALKGGVGGPLVIANDPALIRHVLVDNARNYKMATVRQLVSAADPARRIADSRRRGLEALAQGDGAGVHASPHFWLSPARCWNGRRRSAKNMPLAVSMTSPMT
jgi:hypothetical protein